MQYSKAYSVTEIHLSIWFVFLSKCDPDTRRMKQAGANRVYKCSSRAKTYLWDIVVPPLTLLLLQFDGDASDWPSLDALHQMGHIPTKSQDNTLFHHALSSTARTLTAASDG